MAPSIISVSILYVYVLLRILREVGAEAEDATTLPADTGEAAPIVAHLVPLSPRQREAASMDSTPMPPKLNNKNGICYLYLAISLHMR